MPETYSRPPRSLADASDPREFVRFGQLDRTKLYAQPAIAVRTTSGNLTAAVGDLIVANCANNAVVIAPPANPADGDRVSLLKVDDSTNLLTFNAPTHADPSCEFQGRWSGATLIWSATMSCWLVWSTNVAAMGLTQDVGDSRYAFKSHAHAGSEITSGTVPVARLPVAANGAVDLGGLLSAGDGRIAPLYAPEDHNMKAWTCDPYLCPVTIAQTTNGGIVASLVEVRDTMTVSNFAWYVGTAAATVTSGQSRLGLWRLSDRALVAQSADVSGVVTSTGAKLTAMTATVTLAPGFYYAGLQSVATTRALVVAASNLAAQIGRTAASNGRGIQIGTAYTTALPTSLPTSTATFANAAPWFGLY